MSGVEPTTTSYVPAYLADGTEIYRRSFAMIRAEADLSGLPEDAHGVAVRMIHACGMVDLPVTSAVAPARGAAARDALRAGAPILCDAAMVASGITRTRLPADNQVVCTLRDPRVPELAARLGNTRPPPPLEPVARPPGRRGGRDRQRADGAVPPAGDWSPAARRPGAVLGVPVGFVGAAESKAALARSPSASTWWCTAAAAASPWPSPPINALASARRSAR